jgi:hypothetical protein
MSAVIHEEATRDHSGEFGLFERDHVDAIWTAVH